ncbi:MAG: hypothetical protein AB1393_00410 [Candidatus Edwardsbacteria bacterium]
MNTKTRKLIYALIVPLFLTWLISCQSKKEKSEKTASSSWVLPGEGEKIKIDGELYFIYEFRHFLE